MAPLRRSVILAALSLCACRDGCAPQVHLLEQVEVAGCLGWARDDTCVLEPGTELVLWIEASTPDVALDVEGAPSPEWTLVEGGQQAHITPAGDRVRVRATGPKGRDHREIRLAPPLHSPHLDRARAARSEGRAQTASVALAAIGPASPPWIQVQAEIERARLATAAGDGERVVEHRRAAAKIAQASGIRSEVAKQHLAEVHAQLYLRGDVRAAHAALEAARRAPSSPGAQAALAYTEAYLAQELQDDRRALEALGRAARWALRLDQRGLLRIAVQLRAMSLAHEGRFDEAWRALETALADPALGEQPCAYVDTLHYRAWVRLLAAEARQPLPDGGDADEDLEAAVRGYGEQCPQALRLQSLWIDKALASVLAGKAEAAQHALQEADSLASGAPPLWLELWRMDLVGRIALLQGKLREASELFASLEALARRTGSLDGEWRASIGRARAERRAGRTEGAIAHYSRAEGLLDRLLDTTALMRGRAGMLAIRHEAMDEHVALLLDVERPAEAERVLRRNRARVLRRLDRQRRLDTMSAKARVEWEDNLHAYRRIRQQLDRTTQAAWKSAEPSPEIARLRGALARHLDAAMRAQATAPPRPAPPRPEDELTLTYAEVGGVWVGFATLNGRTRAVRAEAPPTPQADFLSPFDAELSAAARVRLVLFGPFEQFDLHAARWRGAPLNEGKAVAFGLGVGGSTGAATKGPLLLVVDPLGDLPAAREEGRVVREARPTARVLADLAATSDAVRAALAQAGTLHYAGHGRYRGREGWQSELPLADGALTVADVLALERVPRRVVLAGCETARRADGPVSTLGLAHAFVLAGAEAVVAASRPVDDAVAMAFVEALYASEAGDLWRQAQAAQRRLRREHPKADWAAFRVVVP